MSRATSKVGLLPAGSLAHGIPHPVAPGTLFVMGVNGGMHVAPDADFTLFFGRCEPDVHICVGASDRYVSRRHGFITHEGSRWRLHNTGKRPIRFPGSQLILGGQQAELPFTYAPLFIVTPRREHLLEVRIATERMRPIDDAEYEADTDESDEWDLSEEERLALVCLAQRYLRQEPHPQPLTWAQVAEELHLLQPERGWTNKVASHLVNTVRKRHSGKVYGLVEKEVPRPIGNALNHNLITALLVTSTISQDDLALLD